MVMVLINRKYTVFLGISLLAGICHGLACKELGLASGRVDVESVILHPRQSDGSTEVITRRGMLYKSDKAQATLLICHGFMCDKYDVGFIRNLFPREILNYMTFDFRAHGQDVAGQWCTFGRDEAQDVIAAANFLRNHPELKNKPLIAYGFSMGAVASIEAQAKNPGLFDAMILDCPFDSSENVVRRGLENLKFSLFGYQFDMPGKSILQRYALHPYVQGVVKTMLKAVARMDSKHIQTFIQPVNPAESIKKIDVPCFFIHCKNDLKVPMDAFRSVYDGAAGYKELWLTNGRGHFDSIFFNPEEYVRRVEKFVKRFISHDLPAHRNGKIIIDPASDDFVRGISQSKE